MAWACALSTLSVVPAATSPQKQIFLEYSKSPLCRALDFRTKKSVGGKISISLNAIPLSRLFSGTERPRWALSVATSTNNIANDYETDEALWEEKERDQTFDWKSNWYPVCPEMDLDVAVPHPFQILGRRVVIWYDREGAQWRTFADSCPHRLAPLSEGRIDEQGCIQCCYHGWSFSGDGSCTRIPQAQADGPEAKATSKTRAVTFPTIVKQGILFIWPDENGYDLSQKICPPITPEVDIPGWTYVATFRDMDYGYDTGMENLLDPSHVPVAHHNVNGGTLGTRDQAKPISIEVKNANARGFNGPWIVQGRNPQHLLFEAPARTTYVFSINQFPLGVTTTYVTPTAPGKCRVIVLNGRASVPGPSKPYWWQLRTRWWDHQKMLNLLDGDESILHAQERMLVQATSSKVENWSKAFFMPTSADRFVGAFRHWLNRYGGKGVPWQSGVNPTLPPLIEKKEVLLDRYESHTKQCQLCTSALQNCRLARNTLFVLAALLVGGAPLLPSVQHRIPVVMAAGISALIGWRLGEWIQMFYYRGYDHARIP